MKDYSHFCWKPPDGLQWYYNTNIFKKQKKKRTVAQLFMSHLNVFFCRSLNQWNSSVLLEKKKRQKTVCEVLLGSGNLRMLCVYFEHKAEIFI